MLGLSRWGGSGCSYRTVQRVFYSSLEWGKLMWVIFKTHLYDEHDEYVLIGDKTVVTKAGKQTYGLDRFFSSKDKQAVASVCFQVLALGAVKGNWACPMDVSQVTRESEESKAAQASKDKKSKRSRPKDKTKAVELGKAKSKGGRPKGSKNKNKREVVLSPELIRLKTALSNVLDRIVPLLKVKYLLLDGEYGHNAAVQMAAQLNLHMISKLRYDSKLHLPYVGEKKGKGKPKQYGDRLMYDNLPETGLKSAKYEAQLVERIYQFEVWHPDHAQKLNAVIIVKENLMTQKRGHMILFSSDLTLSAERIVRLYSLRFQIEFVFRDAKQHFGLEDFMNVTQTAVSNAANLSLFMTTLARCLLKTHRADCPEMHIIDLKTAFRGRFFATQALKLLPQKLDPIIFDRVILAIASLGRIHRPVSPFVGP